MNMYPLLVPAGSDTEVQINQGNLFGSDSTFTFNATTKAVTAQQIIQSKSSSTVPFIVKSTDGSDQIEIYHDNINAYFRFSDGYISFQTTEGTNTDTELNIIGKGTGRGQFKVYNKADDGWILYQPFTTRGYLQGGGTVTDLAFQANAEGTASIYTESAEGETQDFSIFGYRTGDALRSLQIGVGADVADTVSFDGLSNYLFDGNVRINNGNELRFFDAGNSNYVGFEAGALTGDQIWILPTSDGNDGDALVTNGSGTLNWASNASEKSWSFDSPSGSSGDFFFGGYYQFASTDNDFNPAITWGTANVSYAAHVLFVAAAGGGGGTDTVVRVSGVSITDTGTRNAADTEDVTMDDAGAAGAYYETSKKWLGQVTIEKQSGPDLLCNYGWAKYWDNNNTDFKVTGVEAVWLSGANDANIDIQLLHHSATGWTYNNGAEPDFPTPIASLVGDHSTDDQAVNGENGAWKRTNLSTNVEGSGSEGTLFCVVTSANRTFELGNLMLRVVPQ
ncbi:MAG: hypothetical protein ACYS32_19340 [Planctomycetota bacterium]|jgi:hypothetical protein